MGIFFSHIPKTGGTTFRNILINNYSRRHMDWEYYGKNRLANPQLFPFNSKRQMDRLRSISGHWLRYSPELIKAFPEMKFIIFVREPVSRIISLYFHTIRAWNPNLKFDEWIANAARPEISNFQTRFIAGDKNLDRAIEILENSYFFAGKLEKFDESLCILNKMMGNELDMHYSALRTSKQNKKELFENQKNMRAIEKLRQHNTSDFMLNDYIEQTLLPKYQKKHGNITDKELAVFKKENIGFKFSKAKKLLFLINKNIFNRLLRV